MARRLLTLLLLALTACTTITIPDEREDDPQEAAEYYALKHQGSDDPVASLAHAREQMRAMPRYTTNSEPDDRALGKWTFLGPGNIGGRTRVLLIDSANPLLMYTAGVSGGIWKSKSAGEHWEPVGDDLANIAVNSMAMHPTNHQVIYAGTGEGYFRETVRGTALPLRGDGIYVSRDSAETWEKLPSTSTADFQYVNDLAISTHDPNRIYAATRTGVWRSRDAGTTWSRVITTSVNGGCLDLAFRGDTDGDYLFASCGTLDDATVYRAKNAESDAAWQIVLHEAHMGRTSLAIAPSNPSVVYALSASNESDPIKNQGLLAVYRSSANGDAGSWDARVTNNTNNFSAYLLTNLITAADDLCTGSGNDYITMGWYCNTIAVDPVDADRVWVGGVDLFRSDDGGRTWGVASYWWSTAGQDPSFVHADQHAIVFHPQYNGATNRTAYFTNDGGIFRTDDARAGVAKALTAPCNPKSSDVVFTSMNNSYGVTQFYHGAVSPDGRTFYGGTQDNGTLRGSIVDGPDRWLNVLGGDGGYVAVDPQDPDYVYGESQNGNMARSSNGGFSFRRIRSDLRNETFLFVTPFALDPNFPRRLWIGGRSMWTTSDRGENWKQASSPLPALVSAVAIQPGNSNRVLAGTSQGHIARTESATTATAATDWTLVQPRVGFVSSLAFDPTNSNVAFATYAGFGGSHVWISNDAGATWNAIDGNLPDLPAHSLAVDPTNPNRLYLGTDLGVFVSLDRGATWKVENTGFANAVTEAVFVAQGANGPAVYAFTHGRGAWRAELNFGARRRGARH
jgi:photosystem II stability/assembly factor-like uncharacterized protein